MMRMDDDGNWPKKMISLDGKTLLKAESHRHMSTCNACTIDHRMDIEEVSQDGRLASSRI